MRRLVHKLQLILGSLVAPGMTVADVGSGMGFFTLPLAQLVGPKGKVVCVDVQESMLRSLCKRTARAHFEERIIMRVCSPTLLCLQDFVGKLDFVLAFAVIHELPDVGNFFAEIFQLVKLEAHCLIAEPALHVSTRVFEKALTMAHQAGLGVVGEPRIRFCHTALLRKGP